MKNYGEFFCDLTNNYDFLLLDWSRLPAELNTTVKSKRKRGAKNVLPAKKIALPLVTSQLDVSCILQTFKNAGC